MLITHRQPKQLMQKASGYVSGYTHTLNPYIGCSFGCSYCYVRQMPVNLFRKEDWGSYVDVKNGAAQLLKKELMREKRKGPVRIFMSTSTDPYQPIEYEAKITRQCLEVLAEEHIDYLWVQTRSPLVTRDIDLFMKMKHRVMVSVTIETDRDEIRRSFSPQAPPIAARIKALSLLNESEIPCQAAISPVLPCSKDFAEKLRPVTDRVCIDDYFMGDGQQGRRTKRLGIETIYRDEDLLAWYSPEAYKIVYQQFLNVYNPEQIYISQAGFLPANS
ncbi:SPL family radical SAM protein [Brevibacillus daliensis]|uniref:SPL family radical SAM protein n=1 Tax=Brevibacillus daliensis TaxID=2892995 RepID=UPI001E62DE68|nr:radical SAM protein [Brevibacillus daliensis]